MKIYPISFFFIWCLFLSFGCETAKENEPVLTKDQRMSWWREAKFGMFVHWGVYSVPAGVWKGKEIGGIGEWIMCYADIPVAEYEKLPPMFNPLKYNPDKWVRLAKQAGMKYLVITSKHHDGFAMYDSKVSKYDIVDATPYKQDVLKELSEACKREGIKFCLYYSILDWHHPSQEPDLTQQEAWEKYGMNLMKENKKEGYIKYMKDQLQEIIIQYNPGIIWFDGGWTKWWTVEDGKDMLAYLWKLKPDLIINNRSTEDSETGTWLGDYGTPEQSIPDKGLDYDWETCMTMNDTWGYKSYDHNWKTSKTLIVNLIDVVSKGGNLLLNVGPTDEGLIPEESISHLKEMGKWLTINGEAVYGTEKWINYKEGPADVITDYYEKDKDRSVVYSAEDIRFTKKGNTIYAACLEWPVGDVKITSLGREAVPDIEVKNVSLLGSADKLNWKQEKSNLTIIAPQQKPCEHVYIFKIST